MASAPRTAAVPVLKPAADDPAVAPERDLERADTRQNLMREAMRLLSRDGFHAVSLRQIVKAAGAQNASALHYHFGSREALIREVVALLQDWLEPRACARLQGLQVGAYTVRDVIAAVFGPVLEMMSTPELGRDAVRFIARLGWDFGPEGQELSGRMHRRALTLALDRLRPLLPEVDDETLQFRLILNMNNVYYGLAYRSYLWHSPFGPLPLAEKPNGVRLERLFLDYMEAGLRGLPIPKRPS